MREKKKQCKSTSIMGLSYIMSLNEKTGGKTINISDISKKIKYIGIKFPTQ